MPDDGAVIDLDRAAPQRVRGARRPVRARALLVLLLALAAGAPAAGPARLTTGHRLAPPPYCTGLPIPGGRINIVEGGHWAILDATTGIVVGSGTCPSPISGD